MTCNIVPVTGWTLGEIVALDEHLAGFAAYYLRASSERRQVIAAYLATTPVQKRRSRSTAIFLSREDHKTILRAAYGTVPAGMRGALRRCGSQPHNRRFYPLLHNILSASDRPEIPRAIVSATKIDAEFLMILRRLPSAICRRNVAELMMSVSGAADLTRLVNLLVDHGVDRDGLSAALRNVVNHRQLVQCLERWTLKVPVPQHPVPGSSWYHPLRRAADLSRLARRYQNCLERYLVDALNGHHSFAEVTTKAGERGLIVHLERNGSKWIIEGMFGPRNRPPNRGLREAAVEHLQAHGIDERCPARSPEGPWSVLTRFRLPGLYDFGF